MDMSFSIFDDDDGGLGRAPSVLPGGTPFFSNPGGINTGSTVLPLIDPPPASQPQPGIGSPGWSLFGPDGRIFGLPPLVVLGGAAVALYMFSGKK